MTKTIKERKPLYYSKDFQLAVRIFKEYILPHTKAFIVSVILMLVVAGTTSLHAWLVKPALDKVFVKQDTKSLIFIPLAIFIVAIIKGFATYFQLFIMNLITMQIAGNMRKRLYSHFIYSDIADLHDSSSGAMIANIINEINSIVGAINTIINGFIKQLFTVIFLIILMFCQSIELSLVAFIGFPLAAYPIYKIGKKLRNLSFANQATAQKFNSQMNDTLQYSKLVKAYNCEQFEVRKMNKTIDEMTKIGKKITQISLIASPFVEMLAGIGIAAVIWYGGQQVLIGKTTPGAFFSFFTAMLMAYRPLKSVSAMNGGIQLGLAATERFYQALDKKPTVIDKIGASELKEVQGDIKFSDVHFGYIPEKLALEGISLEIKAGTTVALVGHSGGGKSTIMSLLLRFYNPKQGAIYIDGHNIGDLTIDSLRSAMSVVNQEVMLFDDTVIENIRYGKEQASEEEVIQAAKLAEADEFISKLPLGYHTPIGQNGIKLSGGQRQRIAIARAILYNAPILLLDEATSALDPISENSIKRALATLMKGRTTLVIAHRLSTVIHADKIYVISNAKVIESGTHQELIKKDGAYAHLYSKQFEIELDK